MLPDTQSVSSLMSLQFTLSGVAPMLTAKTKSRTIAISLGAGAAAATSANAVDVPIVHACIFSVPLQANTTPPNCSNLNTPEPL